MKKDKQILDLASDAVEAVRITLDEVNEALMKRGITHIRFNITNVERRFFTPTTWELQIITTEQQTGPSQ